jgi:(4S)-4-hydroxy-5-phosphonooxypentane-2,3-dione isomerase
MYQLSSYFDVPSERIQDFIDAALEDGRDSLANERGTKRFELIQDEDKPNRFYLDEAYDDRAAFEEHTNGPFYKRFLRRHWRFRRRPEVAHGGRAGRGSSSRAHY